MTDQFDPEADMLGAASAGYQTLRLEPDELGNAPYGALLNMQAYHSKVSQVRKPTIAWLENGKIHWKDEEYKDVDVSGILDAFLSLHTEEDALRFVREFGPIGFCGHGLPASHKGDWDDNTDCLDTWFEMKDEHGLRSDDASPYLKYAAGARAIAKLSYELSHGKRLGSKADWHDATKTLVYEGARAWDGPDDLKRARGAVGHVTSFWLQISGVTPEIHWSGNLPELSMCGWTCFRAIAMDLAERVMVLSRS